MRQTNCKIKLINLHIIRILKMESLARHRQIARICALFSVCTTIRSWEVIGDGLH
jgi:hypothetical protein